MNLKTASFLMIAVMTSVLISSCATKMTLEEAKKVTLTTTEKSFVPPPRKANDINDLLKRKGDFKASSTEALTRKANMQPPLRADDRTLKAFYEERGLAAYQLAQYKQALEDLRKAYDYIQKVGGERYVIPLYLSYAESEFGNFKAAINILEDEIPKNEYGYGMYSYLTYLYAFTGDVESASKMNEMCRARVDEAKRMYPRSINIAMWESQVDRSDGSYLQAVGKLGDAEVHFRRFADFWATKKDTQPRDAINTRMYLIWNLIQQRKLLEAELEARKVLEQSIDHTGRDSALTGKIVTALVQILRLQGRLEEASSLSAESIRIFEKSRIALDSSLLCNARIVQGNILFAQDIYSGLTRIYDQAKIGVKDNPYVFDKYYLRNLNIMVSLIKTNRAAEALKLVHPVYETNKKTYGDGSYEVAEALGIRGMAHAMLGNPIEAYSDFSHALPIMLKRNLGQLSDSDRRKRVAMVYEAYLDLLANIHLSGKEKDLQVNALGESFRIANALSGYSVSVAVSESTARTAAAYDPELADLVRREQDTGKEIKVLQDTISDLLAAPGDELTAKGIRESRVRLDTATRARDAILDEIGKRFPKYADYMNPPLPSVELTRQNLHQGETLLSIYTTDDKTYVWAVPKKGDARFAASPLGKKELADAVSGLRRALDSRAAVLGDIPDYDLSLAYDLYRRILKPVERALEGATDILAVVRGPLSQLPLSALPTSPVSLASDEDLLFSKYRNVPWLIRKSSVTILPSVASLMALRSLPAGDPKRKAFAGFGDPIFSREQSVMTAAEKGRKITQLASRGIPVHIRGVRVTEKGDIDNKQINSLQLANLKRLPDTAAEITDIANALSADVGRDVFLGENASEGNVKAAVLSDRRVLAFATHALVPGDLDGLDQPAIALSSPSVTGGTEDGLLTMGEIMKLKLNADWVVLSACNTASSEGGGSEALTGLGRAFFYAGTRALLASMWPVETTSAKKLVSDIFRNQQSDKALTRAGALRKSMTGLIDDAALLDQATGRTVASYAHPSFWAPFVLVGESGK